MFFYIFVNPRDKACCLIGCDPLLRGGWLPAMRKQIADLVNRVLIDTADHISEPIVRIDIVHDTGTDQAVDHSQALATLYSPLLASYCCIV